MSQSYTQPTVTIQGVVYTARRWGQFPTITYKNGGTAGAEVVTIDSSLNITVQIASGVSTNTQIVAAVNAATQADGRGPGDFVVASTGAGGTTPTCTVLVPLAGGLTASVKALLNMGPAVWTAVTAGTAGNSITIQFVGTFSFTVTTVTDGTNLVVSSSPNYVVGATIKQGVNTTTITAVTDATHIVVTSTAGWVGGATAATSSVTAGVEKIKVTATAILIQILDSVSTFENIRAAVAAFGAASALVVVTSRGPSIRQIAKVAYCSAATALAGGLAAAPAAVTINGLTITSKTNDATQNGATLTLVPGGTAGSEVVTMSGNNISVSIADGVSTVTQVQTALAASVPCTTLYTPTGSGGTALQAPYQKALSGAAADLGYGWYKDNTVTVLTASFVYFPFNSFAEDFHVKNDDASGVNTIIGSWDGVNNHFIIKATEQWDAPAANRAGVFMKLGTAAPAYRAWTSNH